MLNWPTAVGFHNPVLSSIKPLISVGLPGPYCTVKLFGSLLQVVRTQVPLDVLRTLQESGRGNLGENMKHH